MKLKLFNSHVLIGAKATTEQAINLPLVPPEESSFTVNGMQYVNYFCSLPESTMNEGDFSENLSNESKVSRCIELLNSLIKQVEQSDISFITDTPVFLLLPEFAEPFVNSSEANNTDTSSHNTFPYFAKKLQGALPLLFNHPQSQLFPFGRTSFTVALAAAKVLFEQSAIEQKNTNIITLISVDSLLHDVPKLLVDNMLVSAESEQGIIPSEGAILCQIAQDNAGVSVDYIQNSVAPSKQRSSSVKHLFNESVAYLTENKEEHTTPITFSQLYLPGNGNEKLQDSWLDAYYQLSDCIDEKTSICQSALFTGELGCVTGLYNFLHLVNGYEIGYLQGKVLQLEVSDSLHQGVVLYSWNKP